MKKILTIILIISIFLTVKNALSNHYLDDVNIISVEVKNKFYSIQWGQVKPKDKNFNSVINLASFYKWTKEDPLFTPVIKNPEKILQAINDLDKTQKFVLGINKFDDENVFPTDFLKELIEVSKKTDIFLKNPTDISAKNLIAQYHKTLNTYTKSAQKLSDKVLYSSKDNYKRPYVYIGIAITPNTVEDDLDLLISNSRLLESELTQRENCLLGKNMCKTVFKSFKHKELNFNKLKARDILPLNILYGKSINPKDVRGIYGARTACISWGEGFTFPMHFFYVSDQPTRFPVEQNITVQISKIVNERFYSKLQETNPEEKIFIDKGILYDEQYETNTYMCPNLTYQPTLATIDHLYVENTKLFTELDQLNLPLIKNLVRDGAEIEKTFFEFPNEDNLEILSSFYGYTYRTLGNILISEKFNQNEEWFKKLTIERDKFLNIYLRIKAKMDNFDLVINRANEDFLGLGFQSEFKNYQYDQYFLYGLRSDYSLFYLPFSPFIYKSNKQPLYMDKLYVKNSTGLDQKHISYQEAIKLFQPEEIEKWYTNKEKIIIDLYEKAKNNTQGYPNEH